MSKLITFSAFALLAVTSVARAQGDDTPPAPRGPVLCKVTSVEPADATFFATAANAPKAPQVGDTTTLDLAAATIGDLKFDQGRAIPLARFGAELTRISPADTHFYDVWFAQHQGVLAYYEGQLIAETSDAGVKARVQLVKDAHGQSRTPYLLQMDCAAAQ